MDWPEWEVTTVQVRVLLLGWLGSRKPTGCSVQWQWVSVQCTVYSTLPVLYAVTACHGPTPDLWWCITGGGWGSCWFSCLSYYTNEYYGCTIHQYRTRRLDLKGYKVAWLVPWIKYILESSMQCNAIYEIQRRSIWYWCSRWRPGCRTDQCSWQRWDTDSTASRSF